MTYVEMVYVNIRLKDCSIGKKSYGKFVYGDRTIENDENTILIKGTLTGRGDEPMLEALDKRMPLFICESNGITGILPRPLCMAYVTSANKGTNTLREFVISPHTWFPDLGYIKATNVSASGKDKHCWIKRSFLKQMRLVPLSTNFMCSFMKVKMELVDA